MRVAHRLSNSSLFLEKTDKIFKSAEKEPQVTVATVAAVLFKKTVELSFSDVTMDGRIATKSDYFKNINTKEVQLKQRQYFEQRKRQHQHQLQQTSCIEKSIHEPNGGMQHHKQHRSLDILNLLNLSSNSHSEVYKAPSISGSEINASLEKCHCAKSPSTFLVSKATLNNFSEFREECLVNCGSNAVADNNDRRLLPSGQAESVALNNCKDACTDPDHQNNAFKEIESRSNQWAAGEEQLSVLGLFGDDEEHGDQAQSPVQEAHVAFSVEGLGKVGTKTPCHSPQQNGTFYSPVKAARHHNFSLELNIGPDDVELDIDEMMQDCNVPYSSSYSEYTLGLTDTCGKMKQKNYPLKSNFRLGINGKTNWHHGDMNIFWDSEKDHDTWDRSRFLDGEFVGENECDVSWKNWSRQTENKIAELFGYGNSEVPIASNEVPHLLRKSVGKKTMDGFNFFEPESLCFDHRTSENNLGLNMHGMARHSAVAVNCDFGDKADPAYWFSSAAEDAKESFSSLRSEESCSSSAARVEVNNGSITQHGTERTNNNYFSSENEDGYRNIFASEQQCKQRDYLKYGDKAKRTGKHVNMANASKSKPLHHSHYPSTANFGSYSRLFERENNSFEINSGVKEECPSVEINSGRSFHQIPPKEAQTFGSIPRTKGPESCFSMLEPGEPVMYSLSGSFIPENFTAHQLFDSNKSYDESPVLSKFGFAPMEIKSGTDLIFGSISPDNIQATGSCGRFVSTVTSAQASMSRNEENKLKLPYTCEKLELGKEIWMKKNDLDSCNYDSNEAKEGSPELMEKNRGKEESPQQMDDVEATHSSDCVDEKKLPLSIVPSEAAITVYKKKHNHDEGLHLQHQEGGKDNVGLEESNTVVKRMRGGSISNVMLLESYALQLLCVQKVLKA